MEIDAAFVRHALDYDPETGVFRWKNPSKMANKRYRSGVAAGGVGRNGRLMINIGRKLRQASRLAWLYVHGEWPEGWLDHADGNPLNNAISNLRPATPVQNNWNVRRTARNSSGYKGVSFHPATGKWRARIRVHTKLISLGLHEKPEEAHEAYVTAAQKHFGEFARAA